MKLLFLDFEATSPEPMNARPIEYCFRVVDTESGEQRDKKGYLWHETYPPLPPESTALTRITQETLTREGVPPAPVFEAFAGTIGSIDWFVGHNILEYDGPLAATEAQRWGIALPRFSHRCIDTMDLPFSAQIAKRKCRVLSHLALEHGIIVDPSKVHGAVGDVDLLQAMLSKYDLREIIRIMSSPVVYVKADVPFEQKHLARARGYRWQEIGSRKFPKTWVKKLRDFQVEEERKDAPFKVICL